MLIVKVFAGMLVGEDVQVPAILPVQLIVGLHVEMGVEEIV
jgi:hypothetical protein